ncbi:GntR family transcriptional regulator [Pelagimonas varians]|uniref:Putative HTH-type transcriptional regulator YdfH n=1 Tax=Pelagimonas varians TaxID=696760 RepID=A0A238KQA1_9RHOB|nr:GntR family transcriptional regulator [Pelagimonas varians]PYG28873.1 DNA-binding GntR family transcriptional regulator [Pelagimonas varians]SMX44292.1 putative HTH-type transcriptional regulator YdfH [Pelagimonas varians]
MEMPDQMLDINEMDGPLGQRVYTVLRTSILEMAIKPGAILRKGALCEQLGVSRSPVADALSKLSSDGLVDIIPQSATRVSRFTMTQLLEENFLREAVEVAAVARVAHDCTDDQFMRLSRNLRLQTLLVEDNDFQGFFEADLEFHKLILSFTGFPKVNHVAEEMTLQLRRARKLMLPEPGRPAQAVLEHQTILKAIENKDAETARTTMARHIRQVTQRIVPLEREHPEFFRTT